MASTTTNVPPWLTIAKENIAETDEWKELTSELFEAVQQQLTENHVSYFSDLTDSEKILFLDRAAKLVRDGLPHSNLVAKISGVLDQRVNEAILEDLMNPLNSKTKTELVLDSACNACSNLLQKWPDLRRKLYSCLNRPLPPKLRTVIWEMFLANPNIRDDFVNRTSPKDSNTLSQAPAIAQRCEAFLFSEPTFQNLPHDLSMHILQVMRHSLIYRHAHIKDIRTLGDTDYLLAIPFLKVIVADDLLGIGTTGCHGDVIDGHTAKFTEVYFTFMDSRPSFMRDSGTKEFYSALKKVGVTMAHILESQDQKLASSLHQTLSKGRSLQLSDCLATLMRSYLRCMFVGYVALDVLCYIWDQYILSIKLPKFQCIPTFAAVLLMLLRDRLMQCSNDKEVEEVLLDGARGLKTRQFQTEIDNRFMGKWRQIVTEEVQGSELPLVDPVATLGTTQPWTWWFRERPPSRQRPEDRRAAREEREAERLRLLQQQRREEARKMKEEEEHKRDQEQALRDTFNQEKNTQIEKITGLERELRMERDTRNKVEREMAEEINRLHDELARLQGISVRSVAPSTAPSASLPPTPTSVHSALPVSRGEEREVEEILRSLLERATGGVQRLVHGTEEQKQEIQQVAKSSMNRNTHQYKAVETALFGHELTTEDWDNMSAEERESNRNKLMTKLKEKLSESEQGDPPGN